MVPEFPPWKTITIFCHKEKKLAKKNYQYEKRQKDIAKKKKQEEKRQRKLNKSPDSGEENPESTVEDTDVPENETVAENDDV
jgi:hypothetical protein